MSLASTMPTLLSIAPRPALADWSVSPREESRFLLQFTADLSPWWLLLLVPLLAWAAWSLYRRDWPALTRRGVVGLTLLRVILLVALIVLAFRPNLVHRRTLTYPGRVAIAVDDSRSMTVRDDRLPDAEALHLARVLGLAAADQPAPYYALAEGAFDLVARLREYERFARTADRASDAFWDRAGAFQQEAQQALARLQESLAAARPVTAKLLTDAAEPLDRAGASLAALRPGLDALFTGDRGPGAKAFADYFQSVDDFARVSLGLQARVDAAQLAAGDKALRDTVAAVRGRSRLELMGLSLDRLRAKLPPSLAGQNIELRSISTGERRGLAAEAKFAPAPAATDLVTSLQTLADEPSDAPLSAVVLLTDGQDVAARPTAPLTASLSRQQTPLLAATLGSEAEPTDVAVAELIAPPIAVVGRPITLELIVKAAIDREQETRVEVTRDGQPVIALPVKLAPAARQSVPVTLTPDKPGLFRYAVRIAPVPGEVFPTENNAAEFALHVREEPVRVLLLDWKPRWETRFALNVLQRLPYLQLNAIIAVTREGQKLPRGGERGSWPDSPAALELYDLVILGDLPPDLLTAAEWDALKSWVENKGGSICFLAPRAADGTLPAPAVARGMLPLPAPIAGATRPATAPATEPAANQLRRADQLSLSTFGLQHPLTLEMQGPIAAAPWHTPTTTTALQPGAVPLLFGPDRSPVIATRGVGKGKSLLIDSDRLWMALNPAAHRAHLQLFVELPTWAIEADPAPAGTKLALDLRRADADRGLQVWAEGAKPGDKVQAIVDGKSVGEAVLEGLLPGSGRTMARFAALPPAGVTFRLGSAGPETPPVQVTRRDRELIDLARSDTLPDRLAAATGGLRRNFAELPHLLEQIEPRQRVERLERTWRLWDAPLVLGLLVLILTAEWVWRKLAGLV